MFLEKYQVTFLNSDLVMAKKTKDFMWIFTEKRTMQSNLFYWERKKFGLKRINLQQ